MTDLSPAADAVLNAVTLKRYDVPYYACPKSIDQIKSDVAAALRAAADQVLAAQWEGRIEPDTAHSLGINWSRDALHAIAAELQAQ